MKSTVILQPHYLPWLGVFNFVACADVFVFLDDVQFDKQSWQSRNRIKTPNGVRWLSVPVHGKGRVSGTMHIKDVLISDPSFYKKHLRTIELNYKKSHYFDEVFSLLKTVYEKNFSHLTDLNIALTTSIAHYMKIDNNLAFVKSSDLSVNVSDPNKRLVGLCDVTNTQRYITSSTARSYMDEKLFQKHSIDIVYNDYLQPVYDQLWGEYVPNLSSLDALFNLGKETRKLLSSTA